MNKKVIKEAINESYDGYREEHNVGCENWAHNWGWKEGAEWILSELVINKKISKETLKEYMNEIEKISVSLVWAG